MFGVYQPASITFALYLLALTVNWTFGTSVDPHFPVFHVRPRSGHVNDPNGPFYDEFHQRFHLFMQYCAYPSPGTFAGCSNKTVHNSMGWYHFSSADLVTWSDEGEALHTDGIGCPNTRGCFSGSTAVVGGLPSIAYPGVHSVNASATHPDGVGMAQCLARPTNRSDPRLRDWASVTIVPTDPVPGDVNNHFHDDAQPWRSASDGRFYTFASGGSFNRTRGVNLLYSTSAADFINGSGAGDDPSGTVADGGRGWRAAGHSLWNITSGQCDFVSCPEMYALPGIPDGSPMRSGPVVFEALCGGDAKGDRYWLGEYNDDAHTFSPRPEYLNDAITGFKYDYGVGRASKSFWHEQSGRRLMWSWINDDGGQSASANIPVALWDSTQSVPRVVSLDSTLSPPRLRVVPAAELDELRLPSPDKPAASHRGVPLRGGRSAQSLPPLNVDLPATGGVRGDAVDVLVNFSWCARQHEPASSVGHAQEDWVARDVAAVRVRYAAAGAAPTTGRVRNESFTEIGFALSPGAGYISNYTWMEGWNLPGGDRAGYDFTLPPKPGGWSDGDGAGRCVAFCNGKEDCTGWTYVRNEGPRCAIKGAAQTKLPVPDEHTISGYKRGHFPPPPPTPAPGSPPAGIVYVDGAHASGHGSKSRATMPLHTSMRSAEHSDSNNGCCYQVQLRVLVDHSVLEVYDGVSAMSKRTYPADPEHEVGLQLVGLSEQELAADVTVFGMRSTYA